MSMNDTLQIFSSYSNTSTIFSEKLFQKIGIGCLLASLSIFTVCGNILVLYAVQTERNLRTVSNLFILSLAVADLAVGLFVMPLSAANIIVGRWPFSSFICKMWLSIDYVASTASIFNLVLLSFDRYWAVVHPLRYLQQRTRRRAIIFILIVWLISLLWAPAVIFWSYVLPRHSDIIRQDECDTSFRLNKTFKTLTTLVNFYVPLITMIIISCRIMVAIRSRSKIELGRRLSRRTQKKMKRDQSNTLSSGRYDNETNAKSEVTDDLQLATMIADNPLDASNSTYQSIPKTNNVHPTIELGQCFCSTCHPYNGNQIESPWQLRRSAIKQTVSLLEERLSFATIKPTLPLFSPTTVLEENENHADEDSSVMVPDNDNTMKDSLNTSNNRRCSCNLDSNIPLKKKLSPIISNESTSRKLSIESNSANDYPKTLSIDSSAKQQKLRSHTKIISRPSTTSIDSSSRNSYLKVPPTRSKDSIITLRKHSSPNSTKYDKTKMSCLNSFINPSRSSTLQKELKAARQLGMLVGVFTISWLPYFILFLVVAWCNHCISDTVYTASIWLGYLNSTVNPLIYPLCNVHFRRAFQKTCYCKHAKTKIPNLNALRELHALHAMRRRR